MVAAAAAAVVVVVVVEEEEEEEEQLVVRLQRLWTSLQDAIRCLRTSSRNDRLCTLSANWMAWKTIAGPERDRRVVFAGATAGAAAVRWTMPRQDADRWEEGGRGLAVVAAAAAAGSGGLRVTGYWVRGDGKRWISLAARRCRRCRER